MLPLCDEHLRAAEAVFLRGSAPGSPPGPDALFERQWAEALVEAALAALAAECEHKGQGVLFGELRVLLQGGAEPPPTYGELAARLALPIPAVRTQVSRLRTRYRERLRVELRRTLGAGENVDDELRELLRVLTAG